MGIIRKAAAGLGIPPEAAFDLARIEICGREKATVENYRRLLTYTDKVIAFDCRKNVVEIAGEGLSIAKMTADMVFISGRIETVSLKNV